MNRDITIWSRGIDRDQFNPERRDMEWRRAQGIADDETVVAFLGRIVMEKGLDVFADAIHAIEPLGVKHRVLVIGEGPARGWFEQQLPDAIFTGQITSIPVWPTCNQAGRPGGLGGDDRKARGHRLQRHVAERLGDRGVEEHVIERRRGRDRAGDLAGEHRVGSCCSNQSRAGPSPTTRTRSFAPSGSIAWMASEKTSSPFSITIRPRKATTVSSSAMPSARRQAMSRRSGLNCSRSMPRDQMAMSWFIRCSRRIIAVDSAGARTISQR